MSLFNEKFYTDDFDQEILDWIEGKFKLMGKDGGTPPSIDDPHLVYGTGIDCFWTCDLERNSSQFMKLTKQQFKEKIGMPESKQEDLQSQKQAELLALPPRDLQSVINEYLWLLNSLTNEEARCVIRAQLTDLTDLQYIQYSSIIHGENNNA